MFVRKSSICLFVMWVVGALSVPSVLQASHQWARMIGGGGVDYLAESVDETTDGGMIVGGYAYPSGPLADAWIAKLDAAGGISWQRKLGGAGSDFVFVVRQTADGGYILGCYSDSFGASADAWVVKLDASGVVVWQKTYGSTALDYLVSLEETADGGYIFGGQTEGLGASGDNAWTVKLSGTGSVEWQRRRYTDQSLDSVYSIKQIAGGGYVTVGIAEGNGSSRDFWFVRTGSTGWATNSHVIGSNKNEWARVVDAAGDGGWYVAGDVANGVTGYDGLLMKLGSTGSPSWQKLVGGAAEDHFRWGRTTADGGFVAVGYTLSSGNGSADLWVVKFDVAGNISWQKTYGGGAVDVGKAITQTNDGGYLVAGYTDSYGSDAEALILRLSPSGEIDSSCGLFVQSATAAASNWSVTDDATASSAANTSATIAAPAFVASGTSATISTLCTSSCQVSCSATVPGSGVVGTVVSLTSSASLIDCSGGAVSYWWTFGDGNTSTDQNPSHSYAAPGDYPWTLNVTSPGASSCLQSGSITIAATATPDLTGTWTSVKKKKSKINGTFSCENIGLGDASAHTVKIYFSKKAKVNKKSKLIKTQAIPSLVAGGVMPISIKATPPDNYKYLVAVVDSDGAVAETDEGNNVVTQSFP